METLSFFKNSSKIQQNNINAAKEFGVFEMAMNIGEIYHRNNAVTKWVDRSAEQKLSIFSDYNCYGATCGSNKTSGFEAHSNSNPEAIHLKGCAIQIDPTTKNVNFVHENAFGTPKFNHNEMVELKALIEAYGYTFGVSNSIFVGA